MKLFPFHHSWSVKPVFFGIFTEVSIICEADRRGEYDDGGSKHLVEDVVISRETFYRLSHNFNPEKFTCPVCGHEVRKR